jgi:hypothetical protein
MLVSTFVGTIFIPLFFVFIVGLFKKKPKSKAATETHKDVPPMGAAPHSPATGGHS